MKNELTPVGSMVPSSFQKTEDPKKAARRRLIKGILLIGTPLVVTVVLCVVILL